MIDWPEAKDLRKAAANGRKPGLLATKQMEGAPGQAPRRRHGSHEISGSPATMLEKDTDDADPERRANAEQGI